MKRKLVQILISLLLIVFTACGTGSVLSDEPDVSKYAKNKSGVDESIVLSDEPDILGYVMTKSVTGNSITVVSKKAQDFSGNDGKSEFYGAISLSNSPKEVQVGELVKVWFDGPVMESYPLQGKVGKLEITPTSKPEGAKLNESEALQKAIGDKKNIGVRSINYDSDLGIWQVEFINIHDDNAWNVEVEDS